jgi:pyruvate dehydrogenase E1 component alpha subunit
MRESGYRSVEEIEQWKQRDPIKLLAEYLLAEGVANSLELTELEKSVRQVAEQAADFARKSPLPDPKTLTDFVFSEAQNA